MYLQLIDYQIIFKFQIQTEKSLEKFKKNLIEKKEPNKLQKK